MLGNDWQIWRRDMLPISCRRIQDCVSSPSLAHLTVNSVWSNPFNNEGLTVLGSLATSEGGFGSSGRLQEVGINNTNHDTCNNLNDGDIVDSVMLCVDVRLEAVKTVGGPIDR
jgi:hypothetical protein